MKIEKPKITQPRTREVESAIMNGVSAEHRDDLLRLVGKFEDIFWHKGDKVTTNNFYEQKIRLKDKTPVYIKNYRLPHQQKEMIDAKIDKMLTEEVIEPSASPYNSPLILVPKKSTTGEPDWRLVVEFRALNKKIIPDKYPLPRIDEILDQLGRARYFSVIDLVSGFHQISLHPGSRDLTSFSTTKGSFRFTRVPFGLNISPNGFCRMMAMAFSGLPPNTAFLYMDDIIVLGCSKKHHLKNLERIFRICRDRNLKTSSQDTQ